MEEDVIQRSVEGSDRMVIAPTRRLGMQPGVLACSGGRSDAAGGELSVH